MRFVYYSNVRLPSEKAHANQIVQMCAALAEAGAQVDLVHPRRVNYPEFAQVQDVWAYYGVPRNFALHSTGSIELFELMDRLGWRGLGFRLAFAAQLTGYTLALVPRLLRLQADVIYSREITTLAVLALLRPGLLRRAFYEAHTFPGSRAGRWLNRRILPRLGGVIAISQGLATDYARLGVPPERLCVAPDAVDPARFGRVGRAEARRKLGWPVEQLAVVYTGHFYAWKGVDTLIEALRGSDAHLYLVGGIPEMIVQQRARLNGVANIHVVGWVPPTEVPCYLAAADVLALPNSGHEAISARHTSPLKLFEYLAAGRPVVASDLPSLREVLADGQTALLVAADDPAALRRGIERALGDPALAARLAENARRAALEHTWQIRAARVLDFARARLAALGPGGGAAASGRASSRA
jgi:glycosyltransferase involved in cell wall biosynthesis